MKKVYWFVALVLGLIALGLVTHRTWSQIAVLVVGVTAGVLAIDLGIHTFKQGSQMVREARARR